MRVGIVLLVLMVLITLTVCLSASPITPCSDWQEPVVYVDEDEDEGPGGAYAWAWVKGYFDPDTGKRLKSEHKFRWRLGEYGYDVDPIVVIGDYLAGSETIVYDINHNELAHAQAYVPTGP